MLRFLNQVAVYLLLNPYLHFSNSQECVPFSDSQGCGPLEGLGTNSWERYDGSTTLDVTSEDKDCAYTLKLSFKHDPSLPIASGPQDCKPEAIAGDNIPYLAFRWYYKSLPSYMKKATKIDHVSIDYNPCGHPPVNVFTEPHYDVHLYLVTPEVRTCMTCNTLPNAPVCDPNNQTATSGRAFFSTTTAQPSGKLANMPEGFQFGLYDNVPLMGGHSWDPSKQPDLTKAPWAEPIWVMGSYHGRIVNFEPMFPLSFVTGNEDKSYTEDLTYIHQTDDQLPTKFTVSYHSLNQSSVITVEGKSAICGKAYKDLVPSPPTPTPPTVTDTKSMPTVEPPTSSSMIKKTTALVILLGGFFSTSF